MAAVILAACSGGGSDATDGTPPAASSPTSATATGPDADAAADSSDGTEPPGSDEPSASTAPGQPAQPSVPAAEHFIANVTEADGSPVVWPEVNGRVGDTQGQVVGAADPTGWYEVSAAGHATTYARPVVTVAGFDILDVELTEQRSPVVIGSGQQQIELGGGARVTVPAGALPAGTWLTATELPARHLSAPWAPVDGGHRTRVFSFESRATDGSVVQPSGALSLHIDDATSLGGVTGLAAFDREAGRWSQSGDCVASGAAVDCTVPHFSLWTPIGGQPYPDPDSSESDGDDTSAEQEAQEQAEEAQRERDEQEQQEADELPQKIRDLLDAATANARSHPSRASKDRLATMIVVAGDYDIDTAAATAQLGAAYEQVAGEVVETAAGATRPRCDQMPALAGVIAEGELVSAIGATAAGQQAAIDLLAEIELECRYYWTGTVEYRFPAPERWEIYSLITPGPGALYEDRGIDEWVETAYVTINVDPDSGQLEGSVSVAPQFVPLRFRLDLNTPEPICPIDSWEDFIVEGVGSSQPPVASTDGSDMVTRSASGAVLVPLEFDGFYEPPQFSVSEPRLAGESGLRVQTQVDVYSFIVPCESISGSEADEEFMIDPYTTQLVDGFGYLSPIEPVVSLNDMLNAPQRTEPDGRIVIEGRRDLSVTMDLAVPFQRGTVTWKFSTQSQFEGFQGSG